MTYPSSPFLTRTSPISFPGNVPSLRIMDLDRTFCPYSNCGGPSNSTTQPSRTIFDISAPPLFTVRRFHLKNGTPVFERIPGFNQSLLNPLAHQRICILAHNIESTDRNPSGCLVTNANVGMKAQCQQLRRRQALGNRKTNRSVRIVHHLKKPLGRDSLRDGATHFRVRIV